MKQFLKYFFEPKREDFGVRILFSSIFFAMLQRLYPSNIHVDIISFLPFIETLHASFLFKHHAYRKALHGVIGYCDDRWKSVNEFPFLDGLLRTDVNRRYDGLPVIDIGELDKVFVEDSFKTYTENNPIVIDCRMGHITLNNVFDNLSIILINPTGIAQKSSVPLLKKIRHKKIDLVSQITKTPYRELTEYVVDYVGFLTHMRSVEDKPTLIIRGLVIDVDATLIKNVDISSVNFSQPPSKYDSPIITIVGESSVTIKNSKLLGSIHAFGADHMDIVASKILHSSVLCDKSISIDNVFFDYFKTNTNIHAKKLSINVFNRFASTGILYLGNRSETYIRPSFGASFKMLRTSSETTHIDSIDVIFYNEHLHWFVVDVGDLSVSDPLSIDHRDLFRFDQLNIKIDPTMLKFLNLEPIKSRDLSKFFYEFIIKSGADPRDKKDMDVIIEHVKKYALGMS